MKRNIVLLLVLGLVLIISCQKELSFEGPDTPAEGSLLSDATGDCLPKTVNGTYQAGVALVPANNTITVNVNVVHTGTYLITTDTVNGFYFSASGIFTTAGSNTVTLRGNGTPFANGVNNFVVSFDSTFCDIQVTVSSPGAGTLAGAPNACAPITVNGSYSPGVALTATNTAVIQANVTTAGAFNITTDTVAGIWFTYSNILPVGNGQNVTLQAQGNIPAATTTGPKTYTVKLGTSQCTFVVNIAGPAAGTVDCSGVIFAGTFTAGQAMTAANNAQISVTVTTPGAYSITTDTVNGVWFNASGNFATAGTTPVTLIANGTPVNSGPFTFTVKWGTSTCTFVCNFSPAPPNDYFPRTTGSNWSYEWDGVATDSLLKWVIAPTNSVPPNIYNIFMETDGTAPPTGDSSGYFRKNGGDYFEYFDLASIGADNTDWVEYIFLKDNQPAGSSWTSPGWTNSIAGTPITFRFKDSIDQKDITITNQMTSTGSADYQNVIVIVERIQVFSGGIWFDATPIFGYFKSYFARGIGLIKAEIFNAPGTGGTPSFTLRLRRYQVF